MNNSHAEPAKLRHNVAFLKRTVFTVAALGVLGAVFLAGGKEGFGYGYHKAIATIRAAVQASQYPTVALTYPGGQKAALYQNGICIPYPHHVPEFYNHFYVSPQWTPCATQHYTTTQQSPALAAITRAVQK